MKYFTLIFLLFPVVLHCQPTEQHFISYYNSATGLTSSNVRNIVQDKYGFIWVGTQDGLFRFDGKTFEYYNSSQDTSHALSGSDIRAMELDSAHNRLWVSSGLGGIDAIDLSKGTVTQRLVQNKIPFLRDRVITCLLKTSSYLIIGTDNGAVLYNPETGSFEEIRNGRPSSTASAALSVDKIFRRDGTILIFSRGGPIYSINLSTKQYTRVNITASTNTSTLPANLWVFNVIPTSTNSFLLASNAGLKEFRIANDSTLLLTSDPFPFIANSGTRAVFDLAIDNKNNIWLTNETGIIKADLNSRQVSIIRDNTSSDEHGWLSSTYHLFLDRQQNVWIGCQQGLGYIRKEIASIVSYFKSSNSATRINQTYYLQNKNDSIAFACAESGFFQINLVNGSIDAIDKGKAYHFVFNDPLNCQIISNDDGTYIRKESTLIPINDKYSEFRPFGDIIFNSYVHFNDSLAILGTENEKGIFIWNFIKHSLVNLTDKSHPLSLKENTINSIYADHHNRIIILSDKSIAVLHPNSRKISFPDLRSPTTKENYNIFFDAVEVRNNIYIATYGAGVLQVDTNFNLIDVISTQTGLSNNGVYKLLPWKDSLLFISTNYGLSSYDVTTKSIRKYFHSDGLHGDGFEETSGNYSHDYVMAGGTDGFSLIYPERFKQGRDTPVLYFNHATIDSKNSKTHLSDLELSNLTISNNALQTTLFFSVINYQNSERTRLSYKIIERHSDWIDVGNNNSITLIGQPPGTYHLQVQAYNEHGIPSNIKELTLIFLPKWYQTWWFKLLLLVAAVGCVYALYWIRINQLKKEHQIRTRLASDLHDDLGSTLNSVKVYTSLALREQEKEKHLHKIKESTQDAITGIKDIIWVLDDRKDFVEDLIARLHQFAQPICEANGITYQENLGEPARSIRLGREEKRNLYMMLKEAINNSIKYSGAGALIFSIDMEKGKLQFSVIDNGSGFDLGTNTEGNGLKNMRRRAKQIKYELDIHSEPGNGTTIRFRHC